MPELPEVETTRRGLMPLIGHQVVNVVVRNPRLRWPIPDQLQPLLTGRKLLSLSRRAKYLLAHFDNGALLLHLGMSGRLSIVTSADAPAKHDHFDLVFNNGQIMRLRDPRRFGAVLWQKGQDTTHPLIASLGPEPLESDFNGSYLHRHIQSRSAPIKTTIMDSHLVVGVGNIYASESLFRARINPMLSANKLSKAKCEKLAEEIKSTLADAIKAGGSSLRDFFGADGSPGYFQQEYFVYGRTDQPCKVCHTPIKQIKQAQRSTFYCPYCQK
jgi:formamidopyrimidine-DNA glycosylase